MTQTLATLLIAHIVLGLIGIGALFALAMALLKKMPSMRFLRISSLIAVIGFILSWISGGDYYVTYYGGPVKAAIKAGPNPWAHAFFMEAKEHVFLLLPFISLALACAFFFGGERIVSDDKKRHALLAITLIAGLIGVFSTLSGVIISGSVR